jgi:hypothetical protein
MVMVSSLLQVSGASLAGVGHSVASSERGIA